VKGIKKRHGEKRKKAMKAKRENGSIGVLIE